MSGNDLNKYHFPKTLRTQDRWFGFCLDELIPVAITGGWFIWQQKYITGIILAALVFWAIHKAKKGKGSSWLRDLAYWYLPTSLGKGVYKVVPESCFRKWIK